MDKHVITLQPSEAAILNAAARIYAAYITSGHVNDANEKDMLERSVDDAVKLAMRVDETVQSEGEMSGP